MNGKNWKKFIIVLIVLCILGIVSIFLIKPKNKITENSGIVSGNLKIYFDDNFPFNEAEIFMKENNLKERYGNDWIGSLFSLYGLPPTFMISPSNIFNIDDCKKEIDDLQKKNKKTKLMFTTALRGSDNFELYFKETDFEKIKKIFTDYSCLSKLSWESKGIISYKGGLFGKKIEELKVNGKWIPVEIDENFLNKIKENNIIDNCKPSEYGYVNCECKKGTLKKDIENLVANIKGSRIVKISISNSVTIKVPEGQEKIWKENIQKKLGNNGSVEYEQALSFN